MNEKLYNKCKSKDLKFSHVAEVGVYLPETSNILNFIKDGIKTTLVEADPEYAEKIKEYFKNFDKVKLYPFAVWDRNGFVKLNKAESSSFVDELEESPAIVNDKYISAHNKNILTEAKTFDRIDDGTIDLLSVDIEGGEWFVIKYMLSRPDVISIETHWKDYINPYIEEIREWMKNNNYEIWYNDKSDTVYMKAGLFGLDAIEKLKLKFSANG